MTNKIISNKRSAHAAQVLRNASKHESEISSAGATVSRGEATTAATNVSALKEQYNVIRKDLMRLREDLTKGYDMAKGFLNRKTFMREILKTK